MIRNPDEEHALRIEKAIEEGKGYCPCLLQKIEDTKCKCKDMRENNICHCNLFVEEEK